MPDAFVHGYALLIAVDEHSDHTLALPSVASDVDALRRVLIDPQLCAYPEENVKVLKGADATRNGILDGITWLSDCLQNDKSGNTTAVVFYTGHGMRVKDAHEPAYFLIPYDANRARLRTSSLRAADFAEEIASLDAKRLLVMLDCCHAAGMEVKQIDHLDDYEKSPIPINLWTPESKGLSKSVSERWSNLAEGEGRTILSSAKATQASYISYEFGMSIFTYHLIEALTGHGRSQQDATDVRISDIIGHLSRNVARSARGLLGVIQEPEHESSGEDFPVALLLGGEGVPKGGEPPSVEESLEQLQASQNISNSGSGTVAIGDNNKVGGERSVIADVIHGDVMTGDNARKINAGTYIERQESGK